MVTEVIKAVGVEAYPGSVALVRYVRDHGLRTAVVSASANCAAVLEEAKIADLFEARVDGIVLEERHLRGKPGARLFLEAARNTRGGTRPGGRVRGCHLRGAGRPCRCVWSRSRSLPKSDEDALARNGADMVVHDLAELIP